MFKVAGSGCPGERGCPGRVLVRGRGILVRGEEREQGKRPREEARACQSMLMLPVPVYCSLQLDSPAGPCACNLREHVQGIHHGDQPTPRRGKGDEARPPSTLPAPEESGGKNPFTPLDVGSPAPGLSHAQAVLRSPPDTGVAVTMSLLPSPPPCPQRDQGDQPGQNSGAVAELVKSV